MSEAQQYAVFLFPQGLASIGDAIKPYLRPAPPEAHLIATQIDSSGPMFGMVIAGLGADGEAVEIELMIPHGFIRLVMSVRSDPGIGFV